MRWEAGVTDSLPARAFSLLLSGITIKNRLAERPPACRLFVFLVCLIIIFCCCPDRSRLPKWMMKYRQDYSSISKKVPTHKNRMNETPMNKYFTDFSPAISRQQ
nr:hypothetical protein [Dickeya dianthicola]